MSVFRAFLLDTNNAPWVAHRRLQGGGSIAEALGTARVGWTTKKQHNRPNRPEPETRAVHTAVAAGKAKGKVADTRAKQALYPAKK